MLVSWLNRIWPPAPKQVPQKPIDAKPFARGYNLSEFRQNAALVKSAGEFWNDSALGGHLMALLINEMPQGTPPRDQVVDSTSVAVGLGRIQGYMHCLSVLRAACNPVEVDTVPEVDYGAAEAKDDWENVPLKDARQNE